MSANFGSERPKSVAIVTGGESGIGRSAALKIADGGTPVVITCFADRAAADAVLSDIARRGGLAIAVQTDVSDEQAVETLFARAEAAFGIVDRLVNSAGLNMSGVKLRDMEL